MLNKFEHIKDIIISGYTNDPKYKHLGLYWTNSTEISYSLDIYLFLNKLTNEEINVGFHKYKDENYDLEFHIDYELYGDYNFNVYYNDRSTGYLEFFKPDYYEKYININNDSDILFLKENNIYSLDDLKKSNIGNVVTYNYYLKLKQKLITHRQLTKNYPLYEYFKFDKIKMEEYLLYVQDLTYNDFELVDKTKLFLYDY